MEGPEPKSCDPQLSEEVPSRGWDLERLGEYARQQHQMMVDGETLLTPAYWRLGMALAIIRRRFCRGQWGAHLASLKINKTRAAKARAIHKTFRSQADLIGLSVEEAYERRRRPRMARPVRQSAAKRKPATLHEFLDKVARDLSSRFGDISCTDPVVAQDLQCPLAEVQHQLNEFGRMLRERARLAPIEQDNYSGIKLAGFAG